MLRTILHFARKEFIQTFRDKRMLIPIFLSPVIMLIFFGYAVNIDVTHIKTGVVDHDRTAESRALVEAFARSGPFEIVVEAVEADALDPLFQNGTVEAAVVIPAGFARDLDRGKRVPVQLILDGTDANSALIIQSYALGVINDRSIRIMARVFQRPPAGFISPETRVWYNPELRTSVFMVPGIISLILLISTLILTAMAVTRERESGTLEQILVSPVRPLELILGKTLPFMAIGLVDVIIVVAAGRLVFDIPFRGSLALLFFAAFLFILTTLSLGLLISTVSRTQPQALMTSFFIIMPAMLLSGVFSPIETMPKAIQYFTLINPLRYIGRIVRGIMLKGSGIDLLWPELLALLGISLILITLSALRFKKYLE